MTKVENEHEQLMLMFKQLLEEREVLSRENEYLKARLNQSILMETIKEMKKERDLLFHLLSNLTTTNKNDEQSRSFKHQNNANLVSSSSHHHHPSSMMNHTQQFKTIHDSQATIAYRPENGLLTSSTIPIKYPQTNKKILVHQTTSESTKPIRKHDIQLKHSQNSPFQRYRSQSLQDLT